MTEPFDLERVIEHAREGILDYGHVTHYSDERSEIYRNLPRAWTTGRTLWNRPELMIVGPFNEEQMQTFINEAVHIDTSSPLHHEEVVSLAGRRFMARDAETAMFLIAVQMFNGIDGLQLVWADPNSGEFPGQPQLVFPPSSMTYD